MTGRSSCFVVVRTAGERTQEACALIAAAQVGSEAVRSIREVPFAEAIRRGFEIGVEADRDWTLCLDADVLLRPGAIAALCDAADAALAETPGLFGVQGLVVDKLLAHARPAGAHLYRTSLLRPALESAPFDARKRRPETHVKRALQEAGHEFLTVDLVLGLHDYEQYHRDLFRKVFTHVRKHERHMRYAARYWRRTARTDPDLATAFLSYQLSRGVNEITDFSDRPMVENVRIDVRAFPDNVDPILGLLGMKEKEPLNPAAIDEGWIEKTLGAFRTPTEYEHERPLLEAKARRGGPAKRAVSLGLGYGLSALARLRRHHRTAPVSGRLP